MIRLIIVGVILAAVMSAIGGFFLYQKSIVNGLERTIVQKDKKINVLKEQIAGLELDNTKLKISNQSLTVEIDRKNNETREAYEEIAVLRSKDAESQTRLGAIEAKLKDRERLDRIENIRNSKKASLLLRLMDKNVRCYVENFDRVSEGKCVMGKFIPHGGRLAPEDTIENEKLTQIPIPCK